MKSLYEELMEKSARPQGRGRAPQSKVDLGLMLIASGEKTSKLWLAAEQELSRLEQQGQKASRDLVEAVEALRPLFGERSGAVEDRPGSDK